MLGLEALPGGDGSDMVCMVFSRIIAVPMSVFA